MKIRHVQIQRFRGIRSLDWSVNSGVVCLIGPGNSCKTTVLDAIGLALSPKWNISFTDSDFFECSVDECLSIRVTVGELPDRLVSFGKFGRYLRGWSGAGGLVDEPVEGTEAVLTIQLRVESSLEPSWTVVTDRNPEGVAIGARDREALGAFHLGGLYLDKVYY